MTGRTATAALLAVSLAAGALLGCSDDDEGANGNGNGNGAANGEGQGQEITGPPIEEVDGQELYELNCSTCHQPGGTGIEGVYPALADSAFVAIDDPRPVAETVVHGRAGMPAWGQSLGDTEIAAILTYLRTDLNDADPVEPETVRDARDRAPLEDDRRDEDDSGDPEEEQGEDPSGNQEEQGDAE